MRHERKEAQVNNASRQLNAMTFDCEALKKSEAEDILFKTRQQRARPPQSVRRYD